ncbi:CheR family methyltransferase [Methanoplanus endosymbiosus]|uniref:Methyltransferase domain-containing protein n=1 Tax=Methanoplanus endosymbiosus TaxID=33865 RepID=A0A9E7PQ11_9EURY|nr:CheR family methyltransferase [Methanoplanus endosymbiosus]UUX93332.1 methyltransferase domain-containing protein [Methanoplanus endosymbiosus]
MAFTFFFRDAEVLNEIPKLTREFLSGEEEISIWDAGCATGAEVYSLVMILRENLDDETFDKVRITASDIDISSKFRKIITEGIYQRNKLNSVSEDRLAKFFTASEEPQSECYRISGELREKVSYFRNDLTLLNPPEPGKKYNFIVCKHVLEHFPDDKKREVVRMFHESLKDGGYLMMEHSQKIPEEESDTFIRASTENNIYRKKTE